MQIDCQDDLWSRCIPPIVSDRQQWLTWPGVIKSYKLTYEPAAIQHAVFDRSKTTNQWTADPRFLKQIIDHFSLSAEQLDICAESGKATFTSFTTKITEGKGMAQPIGSFTIFLLHNAHT